MMEPVTESMLTIMMKFKAKLMATMDAYEMESIGEYREVPKGEATVMPIGRLRKQCRD
jgi:hypothetical protein